MIKTKSFPIKFQKAFYICYGIYSNKRRPFTNFNFQENTNIHISQGFMSLTVCIFNILELNNHLS
jgi:hypothetical protein